MGGGGAARGGLKGCHDWLEVLILSVVLNLSEGVELVLE